MAGYGYAPDVSYTPQHIIWLATGSVVVPAHLKADHVRMEFSDRSNFSSARSDDIGLDISWYTGGTPTVTETLHSWGDSVVSFGASGADDGVLYGDDSATAHTAVSLLKWCSIP